MLQNDDNLAGRRVFLETFGCQMNVLDSQLLRGQLLSLGYRFTERWREADVVLYNTCSVREHAEHKVVSRIGLVGAMKRGGRPEVVLGVIGCMAERDGAELLRKHPQIDLLCGPGELDKLPMLIDNVVRTSPAFRGGPRGAQSALQGNTHRRSGTLAAAEDQLEMLDLSRSFSPDEHQGSAYVRITRGCNKFCTYCVVPQTRGAEVHRPPDHIVDECRRLAEAGVVEVTLLGQTVNHYHFDHAAAVTAGGVQQPQVGKPVTPAMLRGLTGGAGLSGGAAGEGRVTSFAMLLRRIHEEVPGLRRLRFVTSFPRDFGDDILEAMRDCPRICRYLHLPVQSGSDRILKLMNRDHTVAHYRDLLGRARALLPDVQVASDIICGFPTETEEDHRLTCELLRAAEFKNCFIFKYSPRPGTSAFDRFVDDVSDEVKRRRNNELLAIQLRNSATVHGRFVGRTVRVFVEGVTAHGAKRMRKAGGAMAPAAGLASATQAGDVAGVSRVVLGWAKAPSIAVGEDASHEHACGGGICGDNPAAESVDRGGTVTQLAGRTGGDMIVMFEGDAGMVGSIVDVEVERALPLTLFGRLAGSEAG